MNLGPCGNQSTTIHSSYGVREPKMVQSMKGSDCKGKGLRSKGIAKGGDGE